MLVAVDEYICDVPGAVGKGEVRRMVPRVDGRMEGEMLLFYIAGQGRLLIKWYLSEKCMFLGGKHSDLGESSGTLFPLLICLQYLPIATKPKSKLVTVAYKALF